MSSFQKSQRQVRGAPVRRRSGGYKPPHEILMQLNADRENHVRELERLRSTLTELPEANIEEADPAVGEQTQARALIHQIEEHLREIDRAIDAARRSDYGICEHCGEPIDPARLKILPETRMCVKCKRESEKFTQHHFR